MIMQDLSKVISKMYSSIIKSSYLLRGFGSRIFVICDLPISLKDYYDCFKGSSIYIKLKLHKYPGNYINAHHKIVN